MAEAKYIGYVKFPGDIEFTEITNLIRNESVHVSHKLFNDDLKSVIDTFDFSLKYDQILFQKFYSAEDKILSYFEDPDGNRLFTGYISPELENALGEVVESLPLTVFDNSWRLDEEIQESVEYPNTIGETPFYILSQSSPGFSIVHQLLELAGYTTPEIFLESCPDILVQVQHVGIEEGTVSFRETLDDLLREHGYVLNFTGSGEFTVVQWDRNSLSPDYSLSGNFTVNEKIKIHKGFWPYDGLRLTWNTLGIMENALLYQDDLPVNSVDGNYQYVGEDIAPGDYYPSDGDIIETFQDFRSDWLDLAFLKKESRLQNEDISLISSGDHVCNFLADAGVTKSVEEYFPKKSRILFQNTNSEISKIYKFKIEGTALYRNSIRKITVPTTSKKPLDYESKFLFSYDTAARSAVALKRMKQYGIWIYSFTVPRERAEYWPGDLLHLEQEHPAINTITMVRDKQFDDSTDLIKYISVGIAPFDIEAVKTTSLNLTSPAQSEKAQEASSVETVMGLIDNGYTSQDGLPSAGTVTPAGVVIAAIPGIKSIMLLWSEQANLRWIGHYEIQVSADGETWFAPRTDGTDWKGITEGTASINTPMYLHGNIPAAGTVAEPENRTLFYRVRQVTRSGIIGPWSNIVSETTRLIGTGDVIAGSMTADKISALELQTILLRAGVLYVGFVSRSGTTTLDSPGEGDFVRYIDGNEDQFRIFTDGYWSTSKSIKIGGLDPDGNFAPFFGALGCYNPSITTPGAEFFPSNEFKVYNFEGNILDQNGEPPDVISNMGITGAWKKFGDYGLTGNSPPTAGYLQWNDKLHLDLNFGAAEYIYVGEAGVPIFEAKYANANGEVTVLLQHEMTVPPTAILSVIEKDSGGSIVQQKTLTFDMDMGEYFVGFLVDIPGGKISLVINNQKLDVEIDPLSFSGESTTNYFKAYGNSTAYYELYIDDLVISGNGGCSPDLFLQHYLHQLPWSGISGSAADFFLFAGIDGFIRSMGNHMVHGDMHVLGELILNGREFPPNGFVYFQLPGLDDPTDLQLPGYWVNISNLFPADFLRIDDGGILAAAFNGGRQAGKVMKHYHYGGGSGRMSVADPQTYFPWGYVSQYAANSFQAVSNDAAYFGKTSDPVNNVASQNIVQNQTIRIWMRNDNAVA